MTNKTVTYQPMKESFFKTSRINYPTVSMKVSTELLAENLNNIFNLSKAFTFTNLSIRLYLSNSLENTVKDSIEELSSEAILLGFEEKISLFALKLSNLALALCAMYKVQVSFSFDECDNLCIFIH